jgi:hypothetical protein
VENLAAMVQEAGGTDFGDTPLDYESLLDQLTSVRSCEGVESNLPTGGVLPLSTESIASQAGGAVAQTKTASPSLPTETAASPPSAEAAPIRPPASDDEDLAGIAALLALRQPPKAQREGGGEAAGAEALGGGRDIGAGIRTPANGAAANEGPRRENPGAQPARRRDPWAGASIVLSIPRVEKAAKKPVPLSRDWSQSKILTGPDHEAAIQEELRKKAAEEAEKEQKRAERDRRAAENADRAARKKEETERARQARIEKARAVAADKEEAQREKAAKRKYEELWDANTRVSQGLLFGGAEPLPSASAWVPSLKPLPATVRAVRQRRMNKIRIQREFAARRRAE